MQFNRISRGQKTARASRTLAEAIEPRRLLAAVSWDGGGDGLNWNDPNNWSANTLPVAADDVTINIAANPTISLNGAGATINSLACSETLNISAALTVNGPATLNAPTRVSGNAYLSVAGNLTVNDVLSMGNVADSTYGTLYFQGANDVTLGGTGSVVSSGPATDYLYNYTYDGNTGFGKKVTVGSGIELNLGSVYFHAVYGGGSVQIDGPLALNAALTSQIGSGSTRFINNSTITLTGGASVNSYNLVNNAAKSINAVNATLNLYGDASATPYTWDNNGTINLDNSILNFRGTFTLADTGTLSRVNGGEVNVAGELNLAAATLTLDAARGSWGLLSGGRIKNGTIARTGTNALLAKGGTLDNVTLNLPVSVNGYNSLNVENGLVMNDVLTLGGIDNTYGVLQFYGSTDQTMTGTGEIASLGAATPYIYNYTYDGNTGFGKKVTLGSGIEINCSGLVCYSPYGQGTIQNDGPITVNGIGTVQLGSNGTRFINNSTISIIGPSTVSSYNLVNNAGRTINLTNTTLQLYGDTNATPYSWDNNGTINADNAIVNMSGNFTTADVGTLVRTNGGQANVTGVLDLAGGTLTLDAAKGSWGIGSGGRIKNGTIARTGSNELIPRGGVLDNVTLNLPIKIAQYAALYVENNLVLNDVMTIGDVDNTYGTLQFQGSADQTLSGTGSINAGATTTQYIYNYTYDSLTGVGKKITLGSGIEVTASALYAYAGYLSGTVQFDGPLTLNGAGTSQLGTGTTRFINNGLMTLSGNGTILTYNLTNNVGRTIDATNVAINLNGDTNATPYSWDNNGTINANNVILNMSGFFSVADYGTVNRTNGGQVNIAGLLDLAGGTLLLDNSKGSWGLLSNGRLKNGSVSRTAANELIARGGTLDNITLNLPIKVAQFATLYVENNLVLNDLLTLGDVDNTYGLLQFQGGTNQTLSGTGGIVNSGVSTQYIYNYTYNGSNGNGMQLTIGSGIEITGRSFYLYSGYQNAHIVNNGQLIATTADGGWNVYGGAANDLFTNAGSIQVQNGVFELGSLWNNTGTISVTGGTLRLAGIFSLANIGTMSHTGGNVHVSGTLDLASQTLTLDAGKGTWALVNSGIIRNGTIARTGSNILLGQGGTLDNIVLNLPVTVSGANAVYVDHGLTLNDTLTLGSSIDNSYGQLIFIGNTNQTIGGTGLISAVGNNYAYLYNNTYDPSVTSGKTLTLSSGISFLGKFGYLYSTYSGGSIQNAGQIGSNVSGGLFQCPVNGNTTFTNASGGTLVATNGGELRISNYLGNVNNVSLSGAGSILDIDGTYTFNNLLQVGNDALLYARGNWTKSATIDVNGAVVLDYPIAGPSPLNSLYPQLVTGYAAGAWNGNGIRSARAALNVNSYGVGMVDSGVVLGAGGGNFYNRYVDPTAVLVRYTRKGDTDLNGVVNFDDLLNLAQNYGAGGKVWGQGDTNFTGTVDFDDLLALAQNYGQPAIQTGRGATSPRSRSDKFSDVLI